MLKGKTADDRVSCSLNLPKEVWRQAKIRALDEGRAFQVLVADALAQYVARPRKEQKP